MKSLLFKLAVSCIVLTALGLPSHSKVRDIFADTWVATDALQRKLPTFELVGPVKKDQRRVVGIFYITWHSDGLNKLKSPYTADVTKILATDPAARLDANHPLWTEGSYHWGEPEDGYFLSKDEYIIRKDMSMLSDAGVDVLVMDVTNAVQYWDEWAVVFPVMEKMKAAGNKVPKFCFWAFNGTVITVVQNLYDKIYKESKYKDLWFMWDGKPLLLYNGNPAFDANGKGVQNPNPHYDPKALSDSKNPHYLDPDYTEEYYKDYTKEVKKFFTLRTMWWGYDYWAGKPFVGTEDNWSFGYDLGNPRNIVKQPDKLVSTHKGKKEQAAVTPGQHPISMIGKSWTRDKKEPELNERDLPKPTFVPWLGEVVDNPEGYGIYFQQRWDEALRSKPQFLYLNDWNEWSAGKYQPENGGTYDFLNRKNSFFFVDQYNSEFNRTIQPMKGGYTDNYYMQMVQNIRKYKGVRPIPVLKGYTSIRIDNRFKDWTSVKTEYRDTIGDVFHRDYMGYGGLHYSNNSGRNDIITCKVAMDPDKIFFYAECNNNLTPSSGNNWMLLLIDSDNNHDTGWFGYDFIVNKSVIDDNRSTVMKYIAQTSEWKSVAEVDYRYSGKKLELAVDRKLLGLTSDSVTFDFHWADNPADLESPISLAVNGDSAPNRRFNYRCIWKK